MRKIKVLIVAGVMDMGGIENQLMHLLRNADKSKFQIDFTTTIEHPYYEEEMRSLGAELIRVKPTEGIHFVRYCRSLYKVLKEGNFDVVHSHELFHSGLVLWMARLAGVKKRISHAHSCNQDYGHDPVRFLYNKMMRRLILSNATELFACSSLAAEFLYGKGFLKDPRYHLIVNSVDTSAFLAEEIDPKVREEFEGNWKNVLQVGRFSDEKNYYLTTKLAAECRRRNNGIRFVCVGNNGNDYEKGIRAEIERLQIQDYMILKGVRKDVAQLMKCSDAFILPSKYEGMPLTLIEAQASCLSCIAADTFSHEVDFGVDAVEWLNLSASVSDWVDAIESAINRGRTDKEIVVKAIREQGFDSVDFASKLCNYYEME